MTENYYVYAYIRSKASLSADIGTPYYIGKGTGKRAFIKHSCPVPLDKTNIVFIKEQISESDAHQLEVQLITQYGRKDLGTGILHNRTNGGEGISNPSTSTREKMAEAKRNESPETRLKRTIAAKNRIRVPLSEETKRRISEANTGKKRTDEAKEKQSAAKKGKPLSNEHKQKISSASKGISRGPLSAEHRANVTAANRLNAGKRKGISGPNKGRPWTEARRAAQNKKENQNSQN